MRFGSTGGGGEGEHRCDLHHQHEYRAHPGHYTHATFPPTTRDPCALQSGALTYSPLISSPAPPWTRTLVPSHPPQPLKAANGQHRPLSPCPLPPFPTPSSYHALSPTLMHLEWSHLTLSPFHPFLHRSTPPPLQSLARASMSIHPSLSPPAPSPIHTSLPPDANVRLRRRGRAGGGGRGEGARR